MDETRDIVLFETEDKDVTIEVALDKDTVWLNRHQIAQLFDRDIKTIGRHINNAIHEELNDSSVVAKFATTASDGKVYQTDHYNLDVIISIGYRVKSKRGIEFRRWANNVLKDYILKGYAVNNNRINQLGEMVRIMKRSQNQLDAKQVLSVIERYAIALDMLDDYDHQRIEKPNGNQSSVYILDYEECKNVISTMIFGAESTLFGAEKDESFQSSIGTIYQTFDGVELYPSMEEKAAQLLYLITKNHSFVDGNKRIAATMFLYFLDKNGLLFWDEEKIIDDYTLVAITIMIAESRPEEKETMVKLVMNFLSQNLD